MRFGALGDIHGDFASVRRIMRQHPEMGFWLSVGDVADAAGHYEPFEAPLYWIKGNNENFDLIASGDLPAGHHHSPNGTLQTIGGLRVAGLGGTFAPTVYEMPASELPHPKKGTAKATERLVRACGGEVIGMAVLIELGFLAGRETVGDLPVSSILTV